MNCIFVYFNLKSKVIKLKKICKKSSEIVRISRNRTWPNQKNAIGMAVVFVLTNNLLKIVFFIRKREYYKIYENCLRCRAK